MRALFLLPLLLVLILYSGAAPHDAKLGPDDGHFLPRPLIIEYPSSHSASSSDHGEGAAFRSSSWQDQDESRLRCDSWRVAGEANNLSPWKTVPQECAGYVKAYMTGKAYEFDLEMVAQEAGAYAKGILLAGDGRDAWVFDVDETLLSNLPYYADHQYGSEVFDGHQFDRWVEKARAPAIEPSLKLYNALLELGFKIILLTGRSEAHRSVTVDNLERAGFQSWDKLLLRDVSDRRKTAVGYKSQKRGEILGEGYRILGNSGDQWSDLVGLSAGERSFKLPNALYYIP